MVKIAEKEKIVTAFNGKSLNSTVHAVRLDSDSARRQSAELRSLHYRLGLVAEENRHRLTSQTVTLQGERNAQSGDKKEIDVANWPTLHVNAHKNKSQSLSALSELSYNITHKIISIIAVIIIKLR